MSFITKKHIARRTFLQAAGVTLALPLLEAMVPASTALAQTAAAREAALRRHLLPARHGAGLLGARSRRARSRRSCRYILESLEKVKDQTVVLSGLWSKSAEPPEGTTGSDHWVAAAYLTGIKPRKTAGSDATVGSATIDQIIAQKIGQETLLPSLQLAVEDPNSSSSNCGEGYSCSYTNSISWIELPTPDKRADAAHQPAADGAQPAGRVRAPVRQRRDAGSARRAHEAEPQHSRFAARRAGRPARRSRRRRSRARSTSTPTRSARSSGGIQLAAKASGDVPVLDLPPGIPGAVRRSHQAALRSDGAGLPAPTSRAWRRCSARAT